MLVVETIGRIRREHFVKGKSIKEIVRELKVSRNTVRKVLRSGATCFEYARAVQPLPKLGPWRAELDRMLATNEAKSGRERLTLIRLFEELRGLGYEGGYDAVRRYARTRRRARGAATAEAYVPLSFAPGALSERKCGLPQRPMIPSVRYPNRKRSSQCLKRKSQKRCSSSTSCSSILPTTATGRAVVMTTETAAAALSALFCI
jgi:hypothetical protein